MIQCRQCDKVVSADTTVCPRCFLTLAPLPSAKQRRSGNAGALVFLALFAAVVSLLGGFLH